jgi:hopene-associated glycosyltransferase HpnB
MPLAPWLILSLLGTVSVLIWLAILLHPARPWDARPVGDDAPEPPAPAAWPAVAILVPARNEAESLPKTLPALLAQEYPGPFHVVLVDDRSNDGTADVARRAAEQHGAGARLQVVAGAPLPEGWAGKVWALEQGARECGVRSAECGVGSAERGVADAPRPAAVTPDSAPRTPHYLLLTDADILHAPDSLRRLVAESEAAGLALNSRMARLRCESSAERLLIPPFVFFFNLLYPMRRANDPRHKLAAAAGGCVLLASEALARVGGFAAIKGEIIDDVNLARRIKTAGGALRLALSRRAVASLRVYETLGEVWRMVRRSAFTELRHSYLRLAAALLGLVLTFVTPPVLLAVGLAALALGLAGAAEIPLVWAGAIAFKGCLAWALMTAAFRPMVSFYELRSVWAWTLPLSGMLYGAMTLDSALRHARGAGGKWR